MDLLSSHALPCGGLPAAMPPIPLPDAARLTAESPAAAGLCLRWVYHIPDSMKAPAGMEALHLRRVQHTEAFRGDI